MYLVQCSPGCLAQNCFVSRTKIHGYIPGMTGKVVLASESQICFSFSLSNQIICFASAELFQWTYSRCDFYLQILHFFQGNVWHHLEIGASSQADLSSGRHMDSRWTLGRLLIILHYNTLQYYRGLSPCTLRAHYAHYAHFSKMAKPPKIILQSFDPERGGWNKTI